MSKTQITNQAKETSKKEGIISLLNDGASHKEIAAKLNCSLVYIGKVAKKNTSAASTTPAVKASKKGSKK